MKIPEKCGVFGDWVKSTGFVKVDNTSVTSTLSSVCPQPLRKNHLSIATVPTASHCLSALPWTSSKPGVASLLFHRTLSPSDALQVHSYAAKTSICKPATLSIKGVSKFDLEPDIKPDLEPKVETPASDTVKVSNPSSAQIHNWIKISFA